MMIKNIIYWSIKERKLILILAFILGLGGFYSLKNTAVDAIPDLSDVQVIVKIQYPGQSPQIVQNQITYPVTSALMAVPGAKSVRGFSFFGDAYIYVIFEDDTDIYWARSRVLESLNALSAQLPSGTSIELGPDASGVGWVYKYVLVDRDNQLNLAQLTSLQDWFLKYELQSVKGVAEVASVGGMTKQYQVELDPIAIQAHQLTLSQIAKAIHNANQEVGASVIELAEAEYMINVPAYVSSIADLAQVPVHTSEDGFVLLLQDIATIKLGPAMRRVVADFNGKGEVVGGIIVMRHGENAQAVIARVKARLADLQEGLPSGIDIVPVYDRSQLIENAVDNLWQKLALEFAIVILVCLVFLLHFRSALVALISLPLGILSAFIIMNIQGINANIMSLGGIAVAIGAMVDGAIVMLENVHKHLEKKDPEQDRWLTVSQACAEVGPGLFYSLLIITVSFLPVFALQAQEGRLFAPLAYTKTYAMAAAAGLAISLVPVLIGYLVKGKIRSEQENPITRILKAMYLPLVRPCIKHPRMISVFALLFIVSAWYPYQQLGSEFMPEIDEGDLMYMPSTFPGISIAEVRSLLQQSNRMIKTIPEVETVFGKAGRANTATDPAPLTMLETFIQFKPKTQWREGITSQDIIDELNAKVKFPGVSNAWVMPIKTRIDMLSTGIKTPLGIKITGQDLTQIQAIGEKIEAILGAMDTTASVYAERVSDGRYLDIQIDRTAAARIGMSVAELQELLAISVGGKKVAQVIEGQERYSINLRFPQHYRDSLASLEDLTLVNNRGIIFTLADVAKLRFVSGPAMIKSENSRLTGFVYIEFKNTDLRTYVEQAKSALAKELDLPKAYALTWAGQFEYLERTQEQLNLILPMTLAIIVILLYLNFRQMTPVILALVAIPMSVSLSLWFLLWLDYQMSIAVMVGLIALAGVAVETAIIMLIYLENGTSGSADSMSVQLISEQAAKRVRPVLMTSLAIILGLLPALMLEGTGSEVMSRISAPLVGGMIGTVLMTLFVLPALFAYCQSKRWYT